MKNRMEKFRSSSPIELNQELVKLEEKLQNLKFDVSFNKLKNTNELSETRKDIARIKTLLNQK